MEPTKKKQLRAAILRDIIDIVNDMYHRRGMDEDWWGIAEEILDDLEQEANKIQEEIADEVL